MRASSRLAAHAAGTGRAIAATFAAFVLAVMILEATAQAPTFSVFSNSALK